MKRFINILFIIKIRQQRKPFIIIGSIFKRFKFFFFSGDHRQVKSGALSGWREGAVLQEANRMQAVACRLSEWLWAVCGG